MSMMVCNFYDLDLTFQGTLYSWVSLAWDEYYNEVGAAQIEAVADKDAARLLAPDRYVVLTGHECPMLIRSAQIKDGIITAYAQSALCVLGERVVVGAVKSGPAEERLRALVEAMPPWPHLELAPAAGFEDEFTGDTGNTSTVLDCALAICQACDIGIKLVFDRAQKKLLLTLYRPEVDNVARYSPDYGNILEPVYTVSLSSFKTVGFVIGTYEANNPVVVEVGDIESEGADRREVIIDGSEITPETNEETGETETQESWLDRLTDFGLQKLEEMTKIESVDFAVDDSVTVGQSITCIIRELNVRMAVRVTSISLTSQRNTVTREARIGSNILKRKEPR